MNAKLSVRLYRVAVLALASMLLLPPRPSLAADAKQLLQAAGFRGGLIVDVGCGEGRLVAALAQQGRFVVHGLEADAARVQRARAHIRSLGVYGPVSVEQWAGSELPYADGSVNVVVAENLGKVPMGEVMRVLAPGGAALVKTGDKWAKSVKPLRKDTDGWTHYLHDAGGNPVARDRVVGPPRRIQWVADPRHTRSHEHTPGIQSVVSSAGRLFYIADLAPIDSVLEPAQWFVVARDAYNGALLWKRPIKRWFPVILGWTSGPLQLQRRLVAVGDRVYVTMGYLAPLSALDAATGRTVKEYPQTAGAEEIIYTDGTLLVVVRDEIENRAKELQKWAQLSRRTNSPIYKRETALPALKRFRKVESKAKRSLHAIDADSGRVLWTLNATRLGWLRPLSLCAGGGRVYFQKGQEVFCLDMKTGRQLWVVKAPRLRSVVGDKLVCTSKDSATVMSAVTGKPLWTKKSTLCSIRDAFVIGDSLWLGGFRPYRRPGKKKRKHDGPVWGPYFAEQRRLATGELVKQIEPQSPGHHHRCWQNKATERYIVGGRRGAEFIDLKTGDVLWHSWVRGVCRYGTLPCNGLLYAPPHACGCYVAARLDGFYALAPSPAPAPAPGPRLVRGPAFGQIENRKSKADESSDWPTYRRDAQRSGVAAGPGPAALRVKWATRVAPKLSSLTVADGKVFVAAVDEHEVRALNADTGEMLWRFTAGGRVDSPPTIYHGRVLFGSRDGYVYSVRASDGALAWRLQAAPRDRRIIASGQLESTAPAFGSVLVQNGIAYVTAGRSSYLDGGIVLYRIQPDTGEILSRTKLYSPDPKTGRQPAQSGPAYMPGARADILSSDGQFVYLRDTVFGMDAKRREKGAPHLLTITGFLDDTWPHRSFWVYGVRCSLNTGCSRMDRNIIYGRVLAFRDGVFYGFGRKAIQWSNQLQDGSYRLFAAKLGDRKEVWTHRLRMLGRAIVLAGQTVYVAGPVVKPGHGSAVLSEGPEGVLLAVAASDGAEQARLPLDAAPVFDSLVCAGGRLYLALRDGQVLCVGP